MDILNHPLFILAIVVCVAGEYLYSRYRGLDNFNGYEVISNLALISIDKIIAIFTGSDGGPIVNWFWEHRLIHFDFGAGINFALAFIAAEFMYYWNHWYNHYVNIGWATHVMHHSPTKFNLTLGYRLGITRLFSLGWFVFLPLLIIGFRPQDVILSLGIIFLLQFFLHTELVPSLGFLDKILNTPANHRVHHSSDPKYFNKNLGGLTMIFDHMFGTYQADDKGAAMEYGIPEIMNKKNLWHEITCHWMVVFRMFRQASGIRGKLKALFGSPAQ